MSLHLIHDWRRWPRMYSQWAFTTIASVQGSVLVFVTPEQLAAPALLLPGSWGDVLASATAALAVSGFIGRLIAQDLAPPAAGPTA